MIEPEIDTLADIESDRRINLNDVGELCIPVVYLFTITQE